MCKSERNGLGRDLNSARQSHASSSATKQVIFVVSISDFSFWVCFQKFFSTRNCDIILDLLAFSLIFYTVQVLSPFDVSFNKFRPVFN